MKVEYFAKGKLIEKEVSTIKELEVMGREVSDGNIIISMNGYDYTLAEEENAPVGNSYININYATVDNTENNIDVHNLTQLKNALETVQQANAKDMHIQGVLFNDLS